MHQLSMRLERSKCFALISLRIHRFVHIPSVMAEEEMSAIIDPVSACFASRQCSELSMSAPLPLIECAQPSQPTCVVQAFYALLRGDIKVPEKDICDLGAAGNRSVASARPLVRAECAWFGSSSLGCAQISYCFVVVYSTVHASNVVKYMVSDPHPLILSNCEQEARCPCPGQHRQCTHP
jgi:hypothetical protein